MEEHVREGRSLAETPSWALATVITVMVAFGFFVQISLKQFGKWLDRTKRKSLFAALEKIKEELMLFGVLSLLMGHWIVVVAKICVKSSVLNSRFFPCALEDNKLSPYDGVHVSMSESLNKTHGFKKHLKAHDYCSEGHESFASYESLEQLHRLIFVLGTTHVLYSFVAIALAMLKIYSWRVWENEAKTIANQSSEHTPGAFLNWTRMRRMSSFIDHQASHPWSQHRLLVWLCLSPSSFASVEPAPASCLAERFYLVLQLCFSRQFWSSINRTDYMALRLGFITTHELPLSYDFHNYMLRSMEEEFRDIVGISIPLWIYTICCIFLDFHGSNIYFWLSFLPAILILLIGTKLHHVVVKLAVEIVGNYPHMENRQFKLRDELFWFGKPRLLLNLIQLISFQNAFEMATFLWSLWEVKGPSCFMDNRRFIVIRLSFGVISQFWCSFITFPLYVIVTQMGSRYKKTVIAENVRKSLSGWQRRVKARHAMSLSTSHTTPLLSVETITPSDSIASEMHNMNDRASTSTEGSGSTGVHSTSFPHRKASEIQAQASFEIVSHATEMSPTYEVVSYNAETTQFPLFENPGHAGSDNEIRRRSVINNDHVTSP